MLKEKKKTAMKIKTDVQAGGANGDVHIGG